MRAWKVMAVACLLVRGVACGEAVAQYEVANRPVASRSEEAKKGPKFTFIVFSRQNDQKTQQFTQTFQTAAQKQSERANFASVNISDPANQKTVAHYGVSRAPMPLAICVAENGAVTGVFTRLPNEQVIERSLVTPAMATVTKALQDKKIVVVHVKLTPDYALPAGAADFVMDADFAARTVVVDVELGDQAEARFLNDMKIRPEEVSGSVVVVMAPPAAFVGKFPATATRDDIAMKLHAAGKCCNDPNCKHNQRTK